MSPPDLIGSSFFGLDLSQLTNRLGSLRRRVSQSQLLLEFDLGLLRFGVAKVREGQLELSSVGRMSLPEEALERGVPAAPEQMALLLRQLCQEQQINANQVSVALPPEAAFQHVVDLPVELSIDQAREQVLDPAMGLQLPIPLVQTDFDLVPCGLPLRRDADRLFRRYLLVAIPSDFTTRVVTTMQLADLNLQRLELGPLAALRLESAPLQQQGQGEFALWLELQPGCTHGSVLAGSGPVGLRRLVSIRDFPEPELTPEQSAMALSESLCGEEITVHDSRYLALSELDLRVLILEIREWMESFAADVPELSWTRVWISGVNSAHPLLGEMLSEALQLPVQRVAPLETQELAEVGCSMLLLKSGLARLVGLAAGCLPATSNDVADGLDPSWQVETAQTRSETLDAILEPDLPLELEKEDPDDPQDEESAEVPDELRPEPDPAPAEAEQEKAAVVAEQDDALPSLSLVLDASEDTSKGSKGDADSPLDVAPETWPSIQALDSEPELDPSVWPSIHQEPEQQSVQIGQLQTEDPKDVKDVKKDADVDSEDESDSPLGNLRFNDD